VSQLVGGSVVGSSSSRARTVTLLLLNSLAEGSMRVKEPLSHLVGGHKGSKRHAREVDD
jgi:hypothetical protein